MSEVRAGGVGLSVHEQTELMRIFIKYAPVALAMFDRDMRYLLATQGWMKDYGLSQSVIGRSHYEVFPEIPTRWRDAHRRGLAGETLHEEEDRFDRADGGRRWLRWEIRPWLSDDDEVGGIVIFTEDITSRKWADEEREGLHIDIVKRSQWLRAEQRFRQLLNSAPDAMIVVDAKGEIVLANSQAERLYGYASQELLEQPIEMLLCDSARGAHAEHRGRYFSNPRVRSMGSGLELFGRRKDATTFPAEISLSPLQTDEGLLVCAAIRDVSERKKAEEAMAHLAATVECAYDAIYSEDLDGRVRSWNPAAERMFGYSAHEVVGRDIRFLMPSGHEEDRILERIRRGEGVDPYETVRRRKDGSLIDVWLTTAPLKDSRGTVIGATKIARDLTERKDMERKLTEEAQTDALTGAASRRRFRELAQRELARVRRHGGVVSIVAIDVDHFKKINDGYGHAVGDRVLQALAGTCRQMMRGEDVLGRWGGDEFLLLLPDTDDSMAARVAERMRAAISAAPVPVGAAVALHFTVSVGVAASVAEDSGIDELLITADKGLYAAKRAGRNLVRVHSGRQ